HTTNRPMPAPPAATIVKRSTALATLPAPSEVTFPGLFGWSPVPTHALTKALDLDRGLWGTWRCRGIGPAELPASWFRPAPGRPCCYRASDVLAWIAARRGERFDTLTSWRHSLRTGFETDVSDPAEVRQLAVLYARAAGPVIGDVRFTSSGFQAYLVSLLSSE
ncbi:hypothetical protein PUR29_36560, partial [Methylobacterium ajmalii]